MITQEEAQELAKAVDIKGLLDNGDILTQWQSAGLVSQPKSAKAELIDKFKVDLWNYCEPGDIMVIDGKRKTFEQVIDLLILAIEEQPPTQPGALKELIDLAKAIQENKRHGVNPSLNTLSTRVELAESIEEANQSAHGAKSKALIQITDAINDSDGDERAQLEMIYKRVYAIQEATND